MKINVDFIYPIGSVYMSFNSTNPGTLFGGTWVQLKARFLCGVGTLDTNNSTTFYGDTPSSYTIWANETGGENFHTLTINEMPAHTHNIKRGTEGNSWFGMTGKEPTADPPYNVETSSTGSGWGHNNLPPYFSVYMWKRTA